MPSIIRFDLLVVQVARRMGFSGNFFRAKADSMYPLHFCIAVIPLAVYLLLLGILNLRSRPFVTTGARDTGAVAIAIVGLMLIGPMKLFFPEGAASRFGIFVWLMLIVFYGLCVSLSVLLMRSRIVIYNISAEHLRPILTGVAMRLDKRSRWTGDSLWLPELKVHLHLEPSPWMKNIQLTAGGNQQSFESWLLLEKELNAALRKIPVQPNMIGIPMLATSLALAIGAAQWMLADKLAVAQAFQELMKY